MRDKKLENLMRKWADHFYKMAEQGTEQDTDLHRLINEDNTYFLWPLAQDATTSVVIPADGVRDMLEDCQDHYLPMIYRAYKIGFARAAITLLARQYEIDKKAERVRHHCD